MAMMQGNNKPKNAGKPTGGPPLEAMTAENLAPPTGMEGREEDLAKGMQSLVKTMKIKIPYPHDTNDALLKAHLNAIQFAKDNGLLQAYVGKPSGYPLYPMQYHIFFEAAHSLNPLSNKSQRFS